MVNAGMMVLPNWEVAKVNIMKQDKLSPTEVELSNEEFVEQSYKRVREMLKAGIPRKDILTRLARAGEALAGPGASVSILILDEQGLLRNGASPDLPSDYLRAIDCLKPDARVGTCAAAAANGMPGHYARFLRRR